MAAMSAAGIRAQNASRKASAIRHSWRRQSRIPAAPASAAASETADGAAIPLRPETRSVTMMTPEMTSSHAPKYRMTCESDSRLVSSSQAS
jgi:hypothetical protein